LVFNLFPNLISDPSSWDEKKKSEGDYKSWQCLLGQGLGWLEKTAGASP
jgi:hypothetical protein